MDLLLICLRSCASVLLRPCTLNSVADLPASLRILCSLAMAAQSLFFEFLFNPQGPSLVLNMRSLGHQVSRVAMDSTRTPEKGRGGREGARELLGSYVARKL